MVINLSPGGDVPTVTVKLETFKRECRSDSECSNKEKESAGTHSLVYLPDEHCTTSIHARNIGTVETNDKENSAGKDPSPGGTAMDPCEGTIKKGNFHGTTKTEDPIGSGETVPPGKDHADHSKPGKCGTHSSTKVCAEDCHNLGCSSPLTGVT